MKDVKEIKTIEPPYPYEAYAHVIRLLSEEEGGGYLITFPDLPGCMADGDSMEEAIKNGRDAFIGWVSVQAEMGREIPKPLWRPEDDDVSKVSGRFVQRIPRSLHVKLVARAKREGVSLNSLVLAFIAEGIGRREQSGSEVPSRRKT